MNTFGIIGAMEPEVNAVLAFLENREDTHHLGFTFHQGTFSGQPTVIMRSGLGKVSASVATTLMIERFHPKKVINMGSAGGLDPSLRVGDIVISEQVRHHDVDFRPFGFEMGQVYDMPADYSADAELIEAAKAALEDLTFLDQNAVDEHPVTGKIGLVCTGEAFISKQEYLDAIKTHFPSALAVEMEGAAIAQTCFLLKTPFVVVRSLSDIAGKDNVLDFETYLAKASDNSASMIRNMIALLGKFS